MATGDMYVRSAKHNPRKATVCPGTDDYVVMDAWATDRQTAADTVGTITAWVCPDNNTGTFTIIAAGDNNGDEFIDFSIVAGLLHLEASDAGTTDFDLETDDQCVPGNTWTHVAIVQDAVKPVFYANGVLQAATLDAGTDTTCWFDQMSTIDAGDIGILEANSTLTQDFFGGISNVKHWNLALTAKEIMADYKNGNPALDPSVDATRSAAITAAQISHWDMDGDNKDSWAGANDGTLTGNAFLDPEYSSVTSKLKVLAPVVADDISIATDGTNIYSVVVRA